MYIYYTYTKVYYTLLVYIKFIFIKPKTVICDIHIFNMSLEYLYWNIKFSNIHVSYYYYSIFVLNEVV